MSHELYDKLLDHSSSISFQSDFSFDDKISLLVTIIEHRMPDVSWHDYFTPNQSDYLHKVPSWFKLYWLISSYDIGLLFLDDAVQSIIGDMMILGNLVYDPKYHPGVKCDTKENIFSNDAILGSCVYDKHVLIPCPYDKYKDHIINIKKENQSSPEDILFRGIKR